MQLSYWSKVRIWMEQNLERWCNPDLDTDQAVDDTARHFNEQDRSELLALAYGIASRFGIDIKED